MKIPCARPHLSHDPGAPGQPERHETPDPRRSNAVDAGFQCVREQGLCRRQLTLRDPDRRSHVSRRGSVFRA